MSAEDNMNITVKKDLVNARELFGFETDLKVHKFSEKSDRLPEIDQTYKFDKAIEVAKSVMSRRGIELDEESVNIYKAIFKKIV